MTCFPNVSLINAPLDVNSKLTLDCDESEEEEEEVAKFTIERCYRNRER